MPDAPSPTLTRVRRVLWLIIVAALLPAAPLLVERMAADGSARRVTVLMDMEAFREHAALLGEDPFELAQAYQSLGLTGFAFYEETPETLAAKGRVALTTGAQAIAAAALQGERLEGIPASATLVRPLVPGAADALVSKAAQPPAEVTIAGASWFVFPGDVADLQPGGADEAEIARYAAAGFDVGYRPRNVPGMRGAGAFLPSEARYLIHEAQEVAGYPGDLEALIAASEGRWTAFIENNPQTGFGALQGRVPIVRLLSFEQAYLNLRLPPSVVVDKYLLAAEERNVGVLYLRPYTEATLGDVRSNTEAMLRLLDAQLTQAGFENAPLPVGEDALEGYAPAGWLRALAGVGIVAGLLLLALAFPGGWGALVAALIAGLGFLAAGVSWDALTLAAALAFPVLGYVTFERSRGAIAYATAVSLVGALLLVAVGSDRNAVLGVEPFRGVAATLLVPPVVYLAWALLQVQGVAAWLRDAWTRSIRLGPALLALAGVAALALVVLRRGNTPLIGASALELELRDLLSEAFARPRFKELLGHPMAMLGLSDGTWPAWLRAPLLAGGVVAQASILNSFAHYHTPLIVSLERTAVALGLGVALGLLAILVARVLVGGVGAWLRRDAA